jgi:hypothetical protein
MHDTFIKGQGIRIKKGGFKPSMPVYLNNSMLFLNPYSNFEQSVYNKKFLLTKNLLRNN